MKRVIYECDGDGCDCVQETGKPPGTWKVVEVSWKCRHVFLHFCPDCWPAAQAALKLGGTQ